MSIECVFIPEAEVDKPEPSEHMLKVIEPGSNANLIDYSTGEIGRLIMVGCDKVKLQGTVSIFSREVTKAVGSVSHTPLELAHLEDQWVVSPDEEFSQYVMIKNEQLGIFVARYAFDGVSMN